MAGKNSELHRLESEVKADFGKYLMRLYPTCHFVIIPGTYWRLLPYDLYILSEGILRAVELKIDDNEVMAHQYHALFQVVANKGFAFVVRWLNTQKQFQVENFTTGDTRIFKGELSDRKIRGNSNLDIDDRPRFRESAYHQVIEYIMSFNVTPLESEIQAIIKNNYATLISSIARKGK